MKKAVVIYQSKYGSTEKYARWISEELSCDLFKRSDFKDKMFDSYDVIIYGGALFAGGLSGISLIAKNFERIRNKSLVLFSCGLADPTSETNIKNIRQSLSKSLTAEMFDAAKVFHLRGGINYSKLGFVHKTLMSMVHNSLKKRDYDSLSAEDKQLLDTYGKIIDFTNKETIAPIIQYVTNNNA